MRVPAQKSLEHWRTQAPVSPQDASQSPVTQTMPRPVASDPTAGVLWRLESFRLRWVAVASLTPVDLYDTFSIINDSETLMAHQITRQHGGSECNSRTQVAV